MGRDEPIAPSKLPMQPVLRRVQAKLSPPMQPAKAVGPSSVCDPPQNVLAELRVLFRGPAWLAELRGLFRGPAWLADRLRSRRIT
jgi:hypothetical protein